ncbi:MAG: lysophospholipid acyltransferase family protein [Candidatus Omnitrophica bacterium]|nr:lysophospholipid acyltransferase family protein [Candidatus Omnitrophota bacterium]
MDSKKIRKSISRFLGWLGLNFCSLIIQAMPQKWLYNFAKLVAFLGYMLAAKHRRIALESLRIAFAGQKSEEEMRDIAKNCFLSMAKAGAELMFLMNKPALMKRNITIEGEEILRGALAKGKGVILVSAHFGNFPIMLGKLSLEGYNTAAILRHMRDMRAEKMFEQKRKLFGIKSIYTQPRTACVADSIKFLRNNGIIFIPLDQNFGSGGIFVDFFNRKAATATGPVVLALRTKAEVLPCFIIRQKDNTNKIIFEPAVKLEEGSDSADTLLRNTQKLTTIIESYIRRYPAEWGWIHRRWKSKEGD